MSEVTESEQLERRSEALMSLGERFDRELTDSHPAECHVCRKPVERDAYAVLVHGEWHHVGCLADRGPRSPSRARSHAH
jgi:hypothetical protein